MTESYRVRIAIDCVENARPSYPVMSIDVKMFESDTDARDFSYALSAMAQRRLVGLSDLPIPQIFAIPRLSVPGCPCSHCGTIMGEKLRCPGCGWVDPLCRNKDD